MFSQVPEGEKKARRIAFASKSLTLAHDKYAARVPHSNGPCVTNSVAG